MCIGALLLDAFSGIAVKLKFQLFAERIVQFWKWFQESDIDA